MGHRAWFKLWTEPWIDGKISKLPIAVRGTFVEVLAHAADSRYSDSGTIKIRENIGFDDFTLAKMFNIDPRTWVDHKVVLKDAELIEVGEHNEITVVNWHLYQAPYQKYQQKLQENYEKNSQKKCDAIRRRIEGEREVEEEGEKKGSSTYVELFQTSWNAQPRLPRINKMTKGRIRKLQLRRKDEEFCAEWEAAIAALARTPFYTGENDSGWRATVDWFLKNDENWRKLLEQAAPKPNKYAHLCETDEKPEDICPPTPEFKEMLNRLAKEKDMNGRQHKEE